MAVRTTSSSVQDALGDDYVSGDSLDAAIAAATVVVDRLDTLDTASIMSAAALEMVERYLAAHFYCLDQKLMESETTGKSTTRWRGKTDMGFDFTQYGQMAKRLDFTGFLQSLDKGKSRPNISWLGQKREDAEFDD